MTFVTSGLHTPLPHDCPLLLGGDASASYLTSCSVDTEKRGKARHGRSCIAYGCVNVCRLLRRVFCSALLGHPCFRCDTSKPVT